MAGRRTARRQFMNWKPPTVSTRGARCRSRIEDSHDDEAKELSDLGLSTLRLYEAVLLSFLLVFERPYREFVAPADNDFTIRIREHDPFVVQTAPGPGRRGEHLL